MYRFLQSLGFQPASGRLQPLATWVSNNNGLFRGLNSVKAARDSRHRRCSIIKQRVNYQASARGPNSQLGFQLVFNQEDPQIMNAMENTYEGISVKRHSLPGQDLFGMSS